MAEVLVSNKALKGTSGDSPSALYRLLFEKHFSQLPKDHQDKFTNGDWETTEVAKYQTRIVGAEDKISIFKKDEKEKAGICNIKEATSKESEPFLVCAIQLDYSKAPNSDQSFVPTEFPADFLQGEVIFRIGGKEKARIPLHRFYSPDSGTTNSTKGKLSNIYQLVNPKWVLGEKVLSVDVELFKAPAVAGGSDQHQIRATLIGVGATNVAD